MKTIDYAWIAIIMLVWTMVFCTWVASFQNLDAFGFMTLLFVPWTYCTKKAVDALL